jgi:hypothetical protein
MARITREMKMKKRMKTMKKIRMTMEILAKVCLVMIIDIDIPFYFKTQ